MTHKDLTPEIQALLSEEQKQLIDQGLSKSNDKTGVFVIKGAQGPTGKTTLAKALRTLGATVYEGYEVTEITLLQHGGVKEMGEKFPNDSWLAQVEIKDAIDGRAQIYIDGKLVHGVTGFIVEQNAQDKRVPILTLQVQCRLSMESKSIPLLPEPWSWFYVPKYPNFIDAEELLG